MHDPISQTLRLFTILHLIAARRAGKRITRPLLAEACGCSTKTISRDLALLQTAQVPVYWDAAERSFVLPDKGWALPTFLLTPTDALALALVRGLVANTPTFPFAEQVATTLDKATAGLSPALSALVEAVLAAWNDSGGMARDYSGVPLQKLMLGAARKRTVEMLYASRSSGTRSRRVDPYRLDRRDGRYLEMQGWCHERGKVRTFALDRVLEARVTEEPFTVREWDSSDEGVVGGLRGGPVVAVEVCFDSVVAPFARERQWPFRATFDTQEDGSVILRGRVQGLDGIVRELLSWRHHAVVLGGPELRVRMVEEVQALAALYPTP